jgi:hypothetical protein
MCSGKDFFEPGSIATMKLLLRRTLVRLEQYSAWFGKPY